ncbi:zinc finger, CCHC-type containing protein [Tanacetum coccineum]
MGDENPIRTLGDYSKPSHEGYRNTIELPVGTNVVPLRSETIRLVQNRCSFHGLWSEDLNQHLKDFLKLMDSLDLNGENRERTYIRLFQFSLRDQASNWLERLPARSITTWEDLTTHFLAQFFPPGRTAKLCNDILMRLRKLRPDKAWATIERLAQYEDEGWNDAFIPVEMSLDYENPDIEQLLGIMEHKVDTLMKDAISLMGRSKGVFRMATKKMYRPPPEPSRQEEFEHIMMNFILDQEDRVNQLEEYMRIIVSDFMQLSSKVTSRCAIHLGDFIDWEFLARQNLDQAFFNSISTDPFSGPQWGNLFRVNEPIYQELVHEFFASFKFDASPCRIGLYSEGQSRENATLSRLRDCNTVKESRLLMEFWLTIGDGGFNVGTQRPFGLLTNKFRNALSIEPPPHMFKKKSLITIGIIMELQSGMCAWPIVRAMEKEEDEDDDEGDEEVGGGAGHEEARGSTAMYRNMIQGDWQVRQACWMDQQDEQ